MPPELAAPIRAFVGFSRHVGTRHRLLQPGYFIRFAVQRAIDASAGLFLTTSFARGPDAGDQRGAFPAPGIRGYALSAQPPASAGGALIALSWLLLRLNQGSRRTRLRTRLIDVAERLFKPLALQVVPLLVINPGAPSCSSPRGLWPRRPDHLLTQMIVDRLVRRRKELDPVVKPQDMLAALVVTGCFFGHTKNSR